MAIAQLTVDITAKMASFENEIKRSTKVAKDQADSISNSFGKIGDSLKGVVSAYAGLEGIKFLSNLVNDTANYAKEVKNLSELVGISTDSFQALAYGAKSVGINQEKLASIFKDTNEKVGEFLNTGGGELKDFFEIIAPKVGVTADNFRRLSGPEALGLYVSSLEKAGVNHAQMTTYMEAIANDATLLLPLLRNNGEAMKEMGNKAKDAGAIMGGKALDDSKRYSEQLKELEDQASETGRSIATDLMPPLTAAFKFMNDSAANWKKPVDKTSLSMQYSKFMVSLVPFVGEQLAYPDRKTGPASAYEMRGYQGRIKGTGDEGVLETAADIEKKRKAEEDRLKKLAGERSKFASKAQSEAERAKRDAEQQQKAVEDYIKSLDQQTTKFKEQTTEQRALAEIESGRFGKILPSQKERIINSAQIVDADKKELEFQQALEDAEQRRKDLQEDLMDQGKSIFEQMRTPAENYANQIAGINRLYQAGAIDLETLERATKKYFDEYQTGADGQGEKIKELTGLSKSFSDAITNTFMDAIRNGGSFRKQLEELGKQLAALIIQAQIIKPLADSLGSSLGSLFSSGSSSGSSSVASTAASVAASSSGSWWGSLTDWLGELFISFDGGGYTGAGARSGGIDGKGGFYAVLHPDETVVDHTKGQRIATMGGQNIVVNQTYNFGGGTDRMQVLSAAQLGAAMAKQQIIDDRQRGRS